MILNIMMNLVTQFYTNLTLSKKQDSVTTKSKKSSEGNITISADGDSRSSKPEEPKELSVIKKPIVQDKNDEKKVNIGKYIDQKIKEKQQQQQKQEKDENKEASGGVKLVALTKVIDDIIKNQPDEKQIQSKDIEEKDNNDYINVHKMMVEMSQIEKGEGDGDTGANLESFEEMKKKIQKDNEIKKEKSETFVEAKDEAEDKKQIESDEPEMKRDVLADTAKFEEIKTSLISLLTEQIYLKVYQIVEENIAKDSFIYDHEKISKSIIKLASSGYDITKVLLSIDKVQEFYSIVIKDREVALDKVNK